MLHMGRHIAQASIRFQDDGDKQYRHDNKYLFNV